MTQKDYEIITCPECDFDSGKIYWENGVRHIEFTMQKIEEDIFECRKCHARFEASLQLKHFHYNIIDGKVVQEYPEITDGHS